MRFPATTDDETLHVDAFRCTHSGYGHHPQIVECNHCGLVYTNPRWPAEALLQAYAEVEDDTYIRERAGRQLTFARHLRRLEKLVGPPDGRDLLDAGAYIGVFVEVATAAGWNALGVEPSVWAAEQAQQQGLNVVQGTLQSPLLQSRRFDVITLWDVIEHLADPAAEIARACELLNPGGWLVLHTMDIDAPIARLMGGNWPWLMDMHLYYFSRRTLGQMVERTGMRVVDTSSQGRYLSLRYLASRLGGLQAGLGRLADTTVDALGLNGRALPVNFGDLITLVAQKPD